MIFCSEDRRGIHSATRTSCLQWESDPRPTVYKTGALPLSYKGRYPWWGLNPRFSADGQRHNHVVEGRRVIHCATRALRCFLICRNPNCKGLTCKTYMRRMGFEPMRFATTDLETVSLTTRTSSLMAPPPHRPSPVPAVNFLQGSLYFLFICLFLYFQVL
jgi:hypothetical protein